MSSPSGDRELTDRDRNGQGRPICRPVGRFPARQRIRKRPEFVQVQSDGRRVHTDRFVLIVRARAKPEQGDLPRLGVTASRRVGNAVVRNRAKRLVREAFRATRELWAAGIDLVVIVKKPLDGMRLDDVVREWHAASRHIARRSQQAFEDLRARNQLAGQNE